MVEKGWLPILIFSSVILILSCLAVFSPWWEVRTTRDREILNGTQIKVEYRLPGSISAIKVTPSYQIISLSLKGTLNLTSNESSWVLEVKHVFSSIRIPAGIDLGTYYTKFEGNAIVIYSETNYIISCLGNILINNNTIALNFTTINTRKTPEKMEGNYTFSDDMEVTISPLTTSIMELDSPEDVKNSLNILFNTMWILNIAISGLAASSFILTLLSTLTNRKPFYKPLKCLLAIVALLSVIAFFLFIYDLQGLISNLNNVTPPDIYILHGSDVKTLSGKTKDVVFGPSVGWKLIFVIFIMNVALFKLVSKMEKTHAFKVTNDLRESEGE